MKIHTDELLLEPYVDYRADLDAERRYLDSVEAAKRWLGERYLCHEPINRRGRQHTT